VKGSPSVASLRASLRDDVDSFFWRYDGVPERSDERSVQLLVDFRKAFSEEEDDVDEASVSALRGEVCDLEDQLDVLEERLRAAQDHTREARARVDMAYELVRRLLVKIEDGPPEPADLIGALEEIRDDLLR
jgi:hypothetical protein